MSETTDESNGKNVLQLKVTLRDTRPPIWRRIQVCDDITMAKLHDVLQIVMGWNDAHLHEFELGRFCIRTPVPDCPEWMDDAKDARKLKLRDLRCEEKTRFSYTYDMGDNWEHIILVEKILPADKTSPKAVCLKGKLACPPEDCGGVWGYEEILEMLQNPQQPDTAERLKWLNHQYEDGYTPAYFSVEEVNQELQQLLSSKAS